MSEIYRCSNQYIWGLEFYSQETEAISWRGKTELLWKTDFRKRYQEQFPQLKLVRKKMLPYISGEEAEKKLCGEMYLFLKEN